MNSAQREKVRSDLKKLDTVEEIFNYLSTNFDLSEKMGTLTKTAFIVGIDKAVIMLNPKPKR